MPFLRLIPDEHKPAQTSSPSTTTATTATTAAPSGGATGPEAGSTKTSPSQDPRPATVKDAKFLSLIPEVGFKSDTKNQADGDKPGTKEK